MGTRSYEHLNWFYVTSNPIEKILRPFLLNSKIWNFGNKNQFKNGKQKLSKNLKFKAYGARQDRPLID